MSDLMAPKNGTKDPLVIVSAQVPTSVRDALLSLGKESERKLSGEIRWALKRYVTDCKKKAAA